MSLFTDSGGDAVSIVLPTHNRRHLIGRAISSVLAQTHGNWELIVVDDGSTDATANAVAGFSDPRIRYVRNEKPCGPSGARNTGIQAVGHSNYLAFLDDDDEWLPRKLELQIELFRNSSLPLVAVGCGRIDFEEAEPELLLPHFRGNVFEDLLARRARGFGAPLILVKRTMGTPDQLFDVNLPCLEDADYSMRLALQGPMDFVEEPLVKAYRNDGGPHAWNPDAAIRGYEALWKKYERELAERPRVRSYYCVCIAQDLARLGRMKDCRRRLRRALSGSSNLWRTLVWYAASMVGASGVRVSARLFPISPPERR